ncbi:MAG: hypothetical protein RIC87_16875 [Kiloniellales bacterium]
MKVLFIGNSHQLCVKAAVKDSELDPGSFRFLHVHGKRLGDALSITGKQLNLLSSQATIRTDHSIGQDGEIPIDEFDVFVLAALGLASPRAENRFALANQVRHARFAGAGTEGPPLVSEAIYSTMMEDAVQGSDLVAFAPSLHKATNRPVLMMRWPPPCIQTLDPEASHFRNYYGEEAEAAMRWYGRTLCHITQRIGDAFEQGVSLLDSIPADWAESGLTPQEFASSDSWHLNQDYGEGIIRQISATFGLPKTSS